MSPVIAPVAVTHEYPPDDLAWVVTAPDGAKTRWAPDEPGAENVITDITLTDSWPGGDKEGTGRLARNPRIAWPDLVPFSDVRVHLPGGFDVGNYRLEKATESEGDESSITPTAVGYASVLDDEASMIGIILTELSRFGAPPTERQKQLLSSAAVPAGTFEQVGASATQPPALAFNIGGYVASNNGLSKGQETWCFGGGVDIGSLHFDFIGDGTTPWGEYGILSQSDTQTGTTVLSANFNGASATHVIVTAPGAGYKYAWFSALYAGTFAGTMTNLHRFANVKVIGNHGLTLMGTWPYVGFTAKQILGYVIPLLTELSADPEDLEDTGYLIQQAWYDQPGPVSAIVDDVIKYDLLDWWVDGKKKFHLKRPGTHGRRWQAYAGPSGLDQAGLDASRLWRSVIVAYQDGGGITRTVGPPGSGTTFEYSALEITDPDHPAVRSGTRRRGLLSLNDVADEARALEAGEIWLRESYALSRSGSATLTGYVLDDHGVFWPASMVRAGDQIRFPDAADTSYRLITGREYTHDTRTVTIDMDAPPEGMQALLERMHADLQALQLA